MFSHFLLSALVTPEITHGVVVDMTTTKWSTPLFCHCNFRCSASELRSQGVLMDRRHFGSSAFWVRGIMTKGTIDVKNRLISVLFGENSVTPWVPFS